MANLKNLTEQELDAAALVTAKNERLALVDVLAHLAEITTATESGKLDLTKMVLAQNHFRNEAKAALMGHGSELTPLLFPPDAVKANTANR